MTNEMMNTQLYQKMYAEQEQYRAWLLTQPPNEILNHTYEYTIRQDILIAMEESRLSAKQAWVLLKSSCPLTDIYEHFRNQEHGYMEQIRSAIETRANKIMREEFSASRQAER